VEKTEKDVNSKNQPCKHHQSIFIHFLTASILPPGLSFWQVALAGCGGFRLGAGDSPGEESGVWGPTTQWDACDIV